MYVERILSGRRKTLESMEIQAYNPNNKEKSYAYISSGR
jgi:hypothetical protein